MIEGRGTKLYAPLQKQNKAAAKTSSQSLALANRQPANQPEHLTANLQNSRENQTATKTTHASPGGVEAWPNSRGSRFHYNFADIPVFHRPIKGLQAKLTVNVPGDAHEQEADRVAEQVMRMPEPQAASMPEVSGRAAGVQRECACGGSCDDCKRKNHNEDHAKVQMKAAGPVNAGGMEAPPIVYEVLRSSGQPLDAGTRSFMEPRFGHDFSKVRVHTDARAAESARAIGARAYTVGSNMVFGEGEYGPGTQAGQRLLGHELAHVVQQGGVHGLGMIQRREVDDRSCAGLKDIESDIDTEVNKQIDDARKAAGKPMKTIDVLKGVVTRLGAGRISPIETFIDQLGSKKVSMPPTDLVGTKYEGADAANWVYGLQKKAPIVVAGTALVHKICVGSDKLGHFFGQGADYFDVMQKSGATTADAESAGRAMEIGVFGLGTGTVQPAPGVYSNADLAANLAGLKFYQDLKADPKGYKFHIKNYITSQWNEQANPSFYEAKVGSIVWRNLLNGTWEGPLVTGGKTVDSRAIFKATTSGITGSYEWPAGAKSPNLGTIINGIITQKTTSVSGQEPGQTAVSDTPVSGIAIEFDWKEGSNSGKGRFESKDEQTLVGTLGHGKATSGAGTWTLKKK